MKAESLQLVQFHSVIRTSVRCDEFAPHLLDRLTVDHLEPRFGERLGTHVVVADGPLVVLMFSEHHPDESNRRGRVEEDADDVGATADLLFSRPWGLFDQICRQCG